MKIKNSILLIIFPCTVFAAKGTLEERLDALEYSVGVPLTGADIEDEDYKWVQRDFYAEPNAFI